MGSTCVLDGWVAGWAAGWVAGWLSSDPQCPRERAGCELRATSFEELPVALRRCIRNRWDPLETYRKCVHLEPFLWPAGRLAGRGKA